MTVTSAVPHRFAYPALLAGTLVTAAAGVVNHLRLTHRLHHDPLTGLLNRTGLVAAWARNRRRTSAVALLDLDGFKPVNDTHGHAAGDEVLRAVARRGRALRSYGFARLGGDEFAVLLTGDPTAAAAALAAVVAQPVEVSPGQQVTVTASIGLALAPQRYLAAALGRADAAMYRAKDARTGPAVYDPRRDDRSWKDRPADRIREDAVLHLTSANDHAI